MVKKFFIGKGYAVVMMLFFCFVSSCGKTIVPPQPSWEFSPEGIVLNFNADEFLNEVDGTPHSIQVVVYQLEGTEIFRNLIDIPKGVEKLLSGQRFDEKVSDVKKFFIEPGQIKSVVFDRQENTKHIGIVAGYYNLFPKKAVQIYDISFEIMEKGFFRKKKYVMINPIKVDLYLGRYGIKQKNKGELTPISE